MLISTVATIVRAVSSSFSLIIKGFFEAIRRRVLGYDIGDWGFFVTRPATAPQMLLFIASVFFYVELAILNQRFSTGGKVLGKEEKVVENIYIKKTKREKLEKLAYKILLFVNCKGYFSHFVDSQAIVFWGPTPEETPASSVVAGDAKASESTSAKVVGVSTDMHKNYAIVAGVVIGLSSLGWYLLSKDKMTLEDLHD